MHCHITLQWPYIWTSCPLGTSDLRVFCSPSAQLPSLGRRMTHLSPTLLPWNSEHLSRFTQLILHLYNEPCKDGTVHLQSIYCHHTTAYHIRSLGQIHIATPLASFPDTWVHKAFLRDDLWAFERCFRLFYHRVLGRRTWVEELVWNITTPSHHNLWLAFPWFNSNKVALLLRLFLELVYLCMRLPVQISAISVYYVVQQNPNVYLNTIPCFCVTCTHIASKNFVRR